MTNLNAPKDGDFASFLEGEGKIRPTSAPAATAAGPDPSSSSAIATDPSRRTIRHVLPEGREPTEEFLEEWRALAAAAELSDEELARQALQAPGDDGDPRTPE